MMKHRAKKAKAKKSKRIAYDPSLTFRSEPVLPEGQRVKCDLTTRTYRADLRTINADERSIEAVIATEDRVKVVDWSRYEVIEEILRMDGLEMPKNDQVPMLDTHNRFSVQAQLGSTRHFRVEGKKLIARNFYSSSADTEHAWTLCREGHLTDNSVGYRVTNAVMIEAGKTAEVQGRSYTASPTMALRIALAWEIRENSVCPIGADPKAKTRTSPDGHNSNRKEQTMEKFKEWLKARGLDYDKLEEAQRNALQKDFDAEVQRKEAEATANTAGDPNGTRSSVPAPASEPADANNRTVEAVSPEDAQRMADEAVATAFKRQADIRAEANGLGISEETITRCINDPKMTVEAARGEFLKEIRDRGSNPITQAPAGIVADRSVNADRMIDAMLLRGGMDDVILADKTNGEKRAEQADQFRDMSLFDLCRQAVSLEGGHPVGAKDEVIRAAFSTASLPNILGAIYNKSLMRGNNSFEPTWPKWCSVGSVSDFKTITRVRLTATGDFEKVSNQGELKFGSAAEEIEQYNIDTYGKRYAISRQDIINDDLGVLTRLPNLFGRKCQMKIGELVYEVFMANGNMNDAIALFHASHSNLNTSKPLTKDNLAYAIMTYKKQTNKEGKPIKVRPAHLLVPVELEDTAQQIVSSEILIAAGSTDRVQGNKNTLHNKVNVIAEEALSNSEYTNCSATNWYLTADSKEADTVEVSFLNGRKIPVVHAIPKASDMRMEFETYIDAGAKPLDARTVQKNTA